jgi:hypothetical protein
MEKKLNNSIEYITNKVGKETGFSIPRDYLDTIEDEFSLSLSEGKLKKESSFTFPENYFDKLEDKILDKVTNHQKTVKVISLREKIVRFTSIAAAACLFVFIGINSFSDATKSSFDIDSLADSDIEFWLENNTTTFTENDVTLVFDETDFDETELISNNITDDHLEEYLNSIETSTLLNDI